MQFALAGFDYDGAVQGERRDAGIGSGADGRSSPVRPSAGRVQTGRGG